MVKSTKKRLGRPPGRKAPHRPVLAARVPAEFYAVVTQAAQRSGRTVSAEVIWRTQQSFEWEKAHGEVRNLQREARRQARAEQAQTEVITAEKLRAKLEEMGFRQVRGIGWFEPEVNVATWILDNSNKDVLEELLERAAVRALEKMGRGAKS